MTVNFAGHLYNDAGSVINGASVKLLLTGTTTQEGSTVTTGSGSSLGEWAFAGVAENRYDVEITSGSSVRRIRWDDQISLKELDARNNTGATTPAATFSNITDAVANQVAVFSGANATRADNDEIYLSFKLADSAGNLDEFARMTVVATDVTSGSEDGQFEFDVLQGGSLIKAFTIASSTAGAQSIDFNQDSITFGTGTAATDITLTFDAESADGVITWMEDEDYFKFSDDILMNSTERINFYDTAIYIYSSADGQLDLVADTEVQIAATTIDINGAVALNGAITGATDITLSGELDAATLDISGNADIDGTTNLDAVDIDGAVQIDATFTSGVDGQGYDTKFFGDTASAYILWDTSADKLLTAGDAAVDIVKDKLLIGGAAVTTTAAELNVLDNVTAGTVTASLAVVVDSNKDIGTFRNLTIDGVFTDGNYTFDTSGNVSGLGTVASGAITSSGIIKTDDATEATSTTDGSLQTDGGLSVVKDAVFGDDVKLLSDSAVIALGADGDTTLTHTDGTGLTLNSTNKLTFGDTGTFIHQSSDGVLTIESDTTVDINGAVALNGAITGAGAISMTGALTVDGDLDFTGPQEITTSSGTLTLKATTDTDIVRATDGVVLTLTKSGVAGWEWYMGNTALCSGVANYGSLELQPNIGNLEFAILSPGESPLVKFKVGASTGVGYFAGALTAASYADNSDRRVKTNIQTLSSALDKVSQLRGVSFDYLWGNKESKIGLIAQEVESVIPEVVLVSPQPIIIHEGTSDEEEITEVKTLSYGNLVAYLVEAIKELKGEIDKLQEA